MQMHPSIDHALVGGFLGAVSALMYYFVEPILDVNRDLTRMLGSLLGGN